LFELVEYRKEQGKEKGKERKKRSLAQPSIPPLLSFLAGPLSLSFFPRPKAARGPAPPIPLSLPRVGLRDSLSPTRTCASFPWAALTSPLSPSRPLTGRPHPSGASLSSRPSQTRARVRARPHRRVRLRLGPTRQDAACVGSRTPTRGGGE
jgi:hypothetical protein